MNSRARVVLGLVVLGGMQVVSGGCSGVRGPGVEVGAVRVVEATGEGARVEATVTLTNPNERPLPVRETRFTLEIEGVEAAFTFADRAAVTVPAAAPGSPAPAPRSSAPGSPGTPGGPALGVQTIVLPAAFAVSGGDGGGLVGRSYVMKGEVVYEPEGEIRKLLTESGAPLPGVAFETRGRVQE